MWHGDEGRTFLLIPFKSNGLLTGVIESVASGRVKEEESLMLVDSYLSLCRLGLEVMAGSRTSNGIILIPVAAASHFTSAAVNLLYVLLSSAGNNGRITDPHLNATICGRLVKILELVNPSLSGVLGLWQCFLKLLATNGSLSDTERLLFWPLLLGQILALSHDEGDKSRWLQFVKILLKLLKHPLRRARSLDGPALELTVKFMSRFLLPNDPLVNELLALPCVLTDSPWRTEDLAPLKTFINSPTIKNGTLGAAIRESLAPVDGAGQDLLLALLQGHYFPSQANKISMKLAMGRSSSASPSALPTLAILYLALSAPGQAPRRPEALFSTLCAIIVSMTQEGPTLTLLRALVGKLINRHKFGLPPGAPLLQRIIFWTHAGREQMRGSNVKDILEQMYLLIAHLLDISDEHTSLCYWPMSCLVNIARQCPQSALSSRLFTLTMDLIRRPNCPLNLLSLCGTSLLACLRFLETPQISCLIEEALPRLPSHRAMRIFAGLPLAPSFVPQRGEAALRELLMAAWSASARFPLERIELLRHCEMYLKFATDVSLLERPELADLQAAVIAFLQRKPECLTVSTTWASEKDMLVASLKQSLEDGHLNLSGLVEVSLPPPLLGEDDGIIMGELLAHLRDQLERLSRRGKQRALVRVGEIIQSYSSIQ